MICKKVKNKKNNDGIKFKHQTNDSIEIMIGEKIEKRQDLYQ